MSYGCCETERCNDPNKLVKPDWLVELETSKWENWEEKLKTLLAPFTPATTEKSTTPSTTTSKPSDKQSQKTPSTRQPLGLPSQIPTESGNKPTVSISADSAKNLNAMPRGSAGSCSTKPLVLALLVPTLVVVVG